MFDELEQIRAIAKRQPFRMQSKFCYCLRGRKEKRILERGIDVPLKELQIDHFIKMRNQISVVLRTLFTKLERYLLRNN